MKLSLFLISIIISLFSLNLILSLQGVTIPEPTINYTEIILNYTSNHSLTCDNATSSNLWDSLNTPADISYDDLSGGDVNALGYTGTFSFLSGNVGGIDMSGDPWWLSGTNLQLERSLLVDGNFTLGEFILSNLLPSPTLALSLGSGANRWLYLWVQNISAENIDAYNLHLSENLTVDGYINGVNISNLSNQYIPYTGAIKNIDLGNFNLTSIGYGQFAWTDLLERLSVPTPPANTLTTYAFDDNGFSIYKTKDEGGMIRGASDGVRVVKNTGATTLLANRFVYANGSDGGVTTVQYAKANNISTMPAIGITLEDITAGSFGRIMQYGLLENVDTNVDAFVEGDMVYVSDITAGGAMRTPPITPNLTQSMGQVLVISDTIGKVQIFIGSIEGNEFGTINSFNVLKNLNLYGNLTMYNATSMVFNKYYNGSNVIEDYY